MAEKHEANITEDDLWKMVDQQGNQILALKNEVAMYKDHYEAADTALKAFKNEEHIAERENLIKELKEDVDHYFNRAIKAEETLKLYKEKDRNKKSKGKAPNEIIAKLKTDIATLKSDKNILRTAMHDINSLCWMAMDKLDDDAKSPYRLIVMTNCMAMDWVEDTE